MGLQQQFLEKSIKERICLKNILQKLPTEYDYKSYFTPEESYDLYDGVLMKFKKNTSELLGRYFIEVKVRDTHYDTLLLEKKKYEDLIKEVDRKDKITNKECFTDIKSKIVYVSVTPNGTYWFNLSDMEADKFEWLNEYHWASTTDKSKGRINKVVTYLDINKAKLINVKSTDTYVNDKVQLDKIKVSQRQQKCLYEYLVDKK